MPTPRRTLAFVMDPLDAIDIDADSTFALIYEPDPTDDWQDPATLRKVNPNIGVSVSEEYLLDQLKRARRSATLQNAFKTKHLDEWVSVKEAYFNSTEWAALARPEIKRDDFKEMPCYLSGDLASKHDLVALMQLFENLMITETFHP